MKLIKDHIPFTQVANEVLKSKHLSWKAKGIYAYLFSKPDDWDFSNLRIKIESKDGRRAIMSALRELEEAGYLQRIKQPSGKMDYILKFSSQSQETELWVDNPKSGNRTVRKPHCAETALISNIDNTNKQRKESNISSGAKAPEANQDHKDIVETIELFKPVNPSVGILYGRNPQREAMRRLITKYGIEKVQNMIKALPGIVNQKTAPRITTPVQLEEKLGQLIIFVKQNQSKGIIY